MNHSEDVKIWSARQVCKNIAERKISCEEYAQELLSGCRANEDLNAFITLNADHVLQSARQNDQKTPDGLLHGLPIGLKDAIGSAEFPTTAGTPALANHVPNQNAEVVQPLIASGAFVFGKLNLHELSYGITSNNSHTGAVRNPFDKSKIAGGSSGGPGAAVGAGLVPVALGTDTGGSVRIPAALCGVVGFRPSTGRYSQSGIVPVSNTRDTAGPICRSVDDAALIDAVITAEEDTLESLTPSQVRLGVPGNYYVDNLHPETNRIYRECLSKLEQAGFNLVDVDIDGIEPPMEGCGFPIAVYETKHTLTNYLEEFAPSGPSLEELLEQVSSPDVAGVLAGLTAPEFEEMRRVYRDAIDNRRPKLQSTLASIFSSDRLDAIIFPTTILPASPIGDDETVELNGEDLPTFPTFIHNTDPGSIAGIPGISIPGGLTNEGLPVGLELDGPAGSDRHLLAVAALVEHALPPAKRPQY